MSILSNETTTMIEMQASKSQPICKQEDGTSTVRIQHDQGSSQKGKTIEIIVIDSSDSSDDNDSDGGDHDTSLKQPSVVEQRHTIQCATGTSDIFLESDPDSDDSAVDTFFPERQKHSENNNSTEKSDYHNNSKRKAIETSPYPETDRDHQEYKKSNDHDDFPIDGVFSENNNIDKSMDKLRSIILQQLDYGKQQNAKGPEPLQYLRLLNKAKMIFQDFQDDFQKAYEEIQLNDFLDEEIL